MYTTVFLSNPSVQDIVIQANSLCSLKRLGIIDILIGTSIADEELYEPFKETTYYKTLEQEVKSLNNVNSIEIVKGLVYLSPFGESFAEICL
jgi:hypothetical protein